ncbi:formylglycine-generating enzyme family protein [Phragmitibacter flavus]|uniref:Formylglycine-generating enzyme family protein n=1 Tax=Phragmitibacter flavus TaxID=2576071 RepID=A0A5R8KBV7_9BACT|nr:SUMF1/EgtB/PvdO family nonheme iron enzyme [Phragmitibacter flavus]TLD69039.1 formylglycine-generating enzyme family protein [Phragmitibacter flavus]
MIAPTPETAPSVPHRSPPSAVLVFILMLTPLFSIPGQSQQPEPAPLVGLQAHENSQKMPLRPVPGTPVLFAAYPTRVSDFTAFVSESGYQWDHKPHFPQTGDHPVVNITLQDAAAFCSWLTEKERASGTITEFQSYRLPTNREWDAAVGLASAQTQRSLTSAQEIDESRSFPWGLQWPPPAKAGNFNSYEINGTDDGHPYTSPVGAFDPSPQGLHDLAGNVWEWAWDREDPINSAALLRGGSWMYFRKECLTSNYRYLVSADLRAPSIGFRYIFEDKRETATFLANQQKSRAEEDKQQITMLNTAPDVSAEEVAKMRQSLEARRAQSDSSTPVELPDPASLKPATSTDAYTNKLGMKFHPFGAPGMLMGETEVRVQDYEAAQKATGKSWTRRPTFVIQPSHPVVNVTWQEANDFAEWLTATDRESNLIPANARYRLPTDAEWSVAVGLKDEAGTDPASKSGSNTVDYPWGTSQWPPPTFSANLDTGRMSGYADNFSYTSPVGSFSPNTFNLHDLAGNVAEWCSDPWPGAAGERVVRGSSWITSAQADALSSARQHFTEDTALPHIGFRLVLDLSQP